MTAQTLLILQTLLFDPGREHYGLELSEETGLQPGTAYPILLRLEREGWVTSRWEDIDPHAEKRPARPLLPAYCQRGSRGKRSVRGRPAARGRSAAPPS